MYNSKITDIKVIATMPATACYKPSNRYRASVLLTDISRVRGYKVIGISGKNISTTSAIVKN